ncbi:MAG: hypothetical protein WDN25_13515 [Acetobacteraceae bacterium]
MPTNAYPEKPVVSYRRTTVLMADVITYLRGLAVPAEVKRAAYIMFRNESGNGQSGINNNYVGAQADSGRWSAMWDDAIAGTVTVTENGTGRPRIFVAFRRWQDSIDFLVDRVQRRGLYVGGTTHLVLAMQVRSDRDLARAYYKEWVTGSAAAEPSSGTITSLLSMYGQAAVLFPADAARAAPLAPAVPAAKSAGAAPASTARPHPDNSADDFNERSLAGGAFPIPKE